MGSSRYWYRQSESTDEERDAKYRWEKVGEIEGVKVLFPKDGAKGKLPAFSNTPDTMYFKKNDKGKVDQLRIFIGRHSLILIGVTLTKVFLMALLTSTHGDSTNLRKRWNAQKMSSDSSVST